MSGMLLASSGALVLLLKARLASESLSPLAMAETACAGVLLLLAGLLVIETARTVLGSRTCRATVA